MSIENKSLDIEEQGDHSSIKYCIECGARMPRSRRICPACGESQN